MAAKTIERRKPTSIEPPAPDVTHEDPASDPPASGAVDPPGERPEPVPEARQATQRKLRADRPDAAPKPKRHQVKAQIVVDPLIRWLLDLWVLEEGRTLSELILEQIRPRLDQVKTPPRPLWLKAKLTKSLESEAEQRTGVNTAA